MQKINQAAIRNGALDVAAAALLKDADGNDYSPDAAIGAIVMTLGATLGMEAHRNKWWAADGRLVIPEIVPTTQDDIYKAGSGTVLGMLWRRWERAEEKHRFLDSEFRELDASEWPTAVPGNIKRLLISKPGTLDFLDFVANERLGQQSEQDLMHLLTRTRIREQIVGIEGTAKIPPANYLEKATGAAKLFKQIIGRTPDQIISHPLSELVLDRDAASASRINADGESSRRNIPRLIYI
jgi:hypothetical protein